MAIWHQPISSAEMAARLDDWCGLAMAQKITGLAKFVKTLQSHPSGICAYADHQITTAKLEGGNVSIGLLHRRARGFRGTEYLNLKIYQLNTSGTRSFLYARVPAPDSAKMDVYRMNATKSQKISIRALLFSRQRRAFFSNFCFARPRRYLRENWNMEAAGHSDPWRPRQFAAR